MNDSSRTFWAPLLIAIGGMVTTLCGTCTGFFAIAGLIDMFQNARQGYGSMFLILALIIGAIPILVGVLLLRWGLRLRRRPQRPAAPKAFD